jgi:sialate O-acetylesterase
MKMKLVVLLGFLIISHVSSAQVRLPRLIRDSMVLQCDQKINIWGWASPREKLTIRFNNKTYRTTTGNDGKWTVQLNPT